MAATSTLGQIGKCCGELVLYPMAIRTGLAAYVVSAAFVALGVSLGLHVLRPSEGAHSIRRVPASGNVYIDAMTRWDGQWLLQIATEGYTFDPRAIERGPLPVLPVLDRAPIATQLAPRGRHGPFGFARGILAH